jgi:hypothetical protein
LRPVLYALSVAHKRMDGLYECRDCGKIIRADERHFTNGEVGERCIDCADPEP